MLPRDPMHILSERRVAAVVTTKPTVCAPGSYLSRCPPGADADKPTDHYWCLWQCLDYCNCMISLCLAVVTVVIFALRQQFANEALHSLS